MENTENTDENGHGSAMCPNGHPWYADWSTDADGALTLTPATCPDVGAGHGEGCGLGWVARVRWDDGHPPGDWIDRDADEKAIVIAERDRRIEEGSKPIAGVAEALASTRGGS